MERFTNILFSPLDNSQNSGAFRRVAELARDSSARVTLLGIIPEPSRLQRLLHRADFYSEIQRADHDAKVTQLRRSASRHRDLDLAIEVDAGSPAANIIHRVIAGGHDLVAVTTDASGHDEADLKRLLRACPCPVWVIRPTRSRVQRYWRQ